jgi:hypothetical protein
MAVGRVLSGRYRIQELLGRGGMAAVWRAWDLRLDRPVAVKELAGPWLRDDTAVARFDREARMSARLAHPNIVAVHDVGMDGDVRYLVMELVDGDTVSALLARGPLPVSQTIAIAVQACDGLAAAHAAGIIHRDVKPANLILTPAGVVKICDFGIARAVRGTPDLSLTGAATAMGSSKYMAPEQAYGEHVDGRADLYSLGCTIYAMLTGAPPFTGDNPLDVLHLHLTRPPVPVGERRGDVPPELDALVSRLLAKTPAARPADAVEVKARLEALAQDGTAATGPVATADPGVPTAALTAVAAAPLISAVAGAHPAAGDPAARPLVSRGWRLAVAGVIAVVLAVPAAVLAVRSSPSGAGSTAPAPATSPTAVVDTPVIPAAPSAQALPTNRPSASVPSPSSAQPGRSAPASSPSPPSDPVVALRLAVGQQVSTGNLNPDMASDLNKKIDEIARALAAGNTDDAAKKIKEFRDKLDTLLAEGRLTRAGYDVLVQDLDRVAAELP